MNKSSIILGLVFLFLISSINAVQNGLVLYSFNSPGSMPIGLAWDGTYLVDGDNALTPYFHGGLLRLNSSNGNFVDGKDTIDPWGITYDGSTYWIADYPAKKIYQYDYQSDSLVKTLILNFKPFGLDWDGTNLLVSDYDNGIIYTMDTDGNIINYISPSGVNSITDLAYDGIYLWAGSCNTNKIYKLDMQGNIIDYFTSPGPCPYGLTYDGANLWSSSWNSNIIYKLSVNHAPTIDFYSPELNLSIDEGAEQEFIVNASDIDEDSLDFYWYLNNNLILNLSDFMFSPAGNYILKAEVSDGKLNNSLEWNITVNDVCVPIISSTNSTCQSDNIFIETFTDSNSCYNLTLLTTDSIPEPILHNCTYIAPSAPSGGGGSGGGGGSSCSSKWTCISWDNCTNEKQKCLDWSDEKKCNNPKDKPKDQTKDCVEEKKEIKQEAPQESNNKKQENNLITGGAVTETKGFDLINSIGGFFTNIVNWFKELFSK